MIRHHTARFLRSLRRQKLFSTINLLGLTVSIACSLLIYLYVRHELSYDRFHRDAERIYRINQTFIWGDNTDNQFASTGPGVAYAIKAEVPEVELLTSIHTPGNFLVSYTTPSGDVVTFEENRVLAADTNFFAMFNFPLLKGDHASALREANTMVITQSAARKYFGDENPVGKLVRLGGSDAGQSRTYEVTGVVQDTPDNSYIQFDMLLSMKGFPIERFYWSWVWTQLETFVRLHEGSNMETVHARLKEIPRKHAEQTLQWVMNTTFDDYERSGKKWELFLQPLTDIHLPSQTVYNRLNDSANRKTVYSLAAAGLVVILLACVNFMNLSTAQFTRRIKEASLRKILGQKKSAIAIGYFFEALGFCLVAMVVAVALSQWLLPFFNLTTGKHLELNLGVDTSLLAALFATVMLMAALSGAYPAWFLNRFHPAEAIKGKIRSGHQGKSFRNALVVFQFAISIVLMVCTAVVFQQLSYVSEKDLGFNKHNLMVLKHVEQVKTGSTLVSDLRVIPGVLNASECTSLPPTIFGGDTFTAEGIDERLSLNFTSADDNYIPTLDVKLVIGRNFYRDTPADSNKVILNETAIRKIGWTADESVIGKKITYPADPGAAFEVIGIISDFNYWSLDAPVEPMAIFHLTNQRVFAGTKEYLALRIGSQDNLAWQNTIAQVNDIWKKHAGDIPFEYTFVDEVFAETFKSSQQLGKVLTVMALLAIIIACLGLLGMITYALERRTKEICIRKVAGASAGNIFLLVSKGHTKLIAIAFVIAAPVSWWLMQIWLEDFAYRITPSPGIFLFAGGITLLMAVVITAYHSLRAAFMNPVDALRDE
jgi:putative ABC transport system permease protein